MHLSKPKCSIFVLRPQLAIALVLILLFVPLVVAAQETASGSFRVIHNFTGGKDGAYPYAGLIIDQSGNLYGTAFAGGRGTCLPQDIGCGTIFKLTHSASGWSFKTVYAFQGGNDGAGPYDTVVIGPNSSLYGTTVEGGNQTCPSGCGVVFELKPPTAACETEVCPSTETVLYRFRGNTDGFYPYSNVIFDKAGNLYGTTEQGGTGANGGPGTVFELAASKRGWAKRTLYNFSESPGNPYSGVTFDRAGNLYGTLAQSSNYGAVYQLSRSGSTWTENIIHTFQADKDGYNPVASVILGKSGNLIGATDSGGPQGGGTVYSLRSLKSGWVLTTLYGFPNQGTGPWAQLMDAGGDRYGTTQGNPSVGTWGTVFKLTHTSSGWKETLLHRFTGGSDGGIPLSTIVLDSHGNLYGTASAGGASNVGVVFEIRP
jgi:uncharacterized repeat protein (TIGR03803 family)